MKFGLLNADDVASRLAVALVAAGHELTLLYDAGESAHALRAVAPEARDCSEWEEALACGADFVLVGAAGPEAQRLEQIQRLAQEGMPTALSHPQTTATLAYFELDMHRQATGIALVPLELTRHEPAFARIAELGRIDEVVIERRTTERSRDAVLKSFIRDIGAARRLVGECEKVSAMGSLGDETTPAQLGIQITSKSGALVRWSLGAGAAESNHWRVIAAGATAEIAPNGDEDWPLRVRRADQTEESIEFPEGATIAAAAAAVAVAIRDPANALWREALADLELVEAVERSLRKGRTVELFHEEASEEGTFHGVMAAGGCLLLLLGIGLAITATVVGRFRFWIADLWPYALLAVLAIFLLAQFLKFVFPKSDNR